ncbi:MAG: ATP-dependent DNA helicase [Bacilli bacterium]|nr:ATP-dependent DNA helicase [Bacilli bacterium]
MKEVRISAKEIAELLYGTGNLANERMLAVRQQEGIEIHQYWQAKYLPTDEKEVFVKQEMAIDDIQLTVSGRIDGIIVRDGDLMLEEIKSTHADLETLEENTYPSHLAQAKLYAYMYCVEKDLKRLTVVLTYVEVETKESVTFEKNYPLRSLKLFFDKTISKYLEWIKLLEEHENERQKSIEGLIFPFPEYRPFQREMMAYVYRNILEKGILYVTAPTGIGKTIATLFSALKAINAPRQKVFYLTAKNDGKEIALDTIELLEMNNLVAKTCEITAKDQMCFLKERDCDPEVCKYANGYYDRVYKTIRDVFSNESLIRKDVIRKYARKHRVCPFELSLDLSNHCDIIICDYNYVFDPRVRLIRYFQEDSAVPILLVDEAHNLVQRSRDMYSATLTNQMFVELRELTKYLKPNPAREISRLMDLFAEFELELIEVDFVKHEEINDYLLQLLKRLLVKLDQVLTSDKKIANRNQIMDVYFAVAQFVKISEYYNHEFVFLLERTAEMISVSIKCLNASRYILDTIQNHAEACTFFSATLDPIDYYKTLLTQKIGIEVKMPSPFKRDNLLLMVAEHVSTRYNDRKNSIKEVVQAAEALVMGKKGNYIMFFPSYEYLKMVEEQLSFDPENIEIIRQTRAMTLLERTSTIRMFKTESLKTQVGLFVMGGIFGESIDLIGDMLSGVLIVGVGLPALSPFNNILRSHFDIEFHQGFDYAYTYPGLNKVVQAVGRVIRSDTDRGIAILMDDRFASSRYLSLYPKEWQHLKIYDNPDLIRKEIASFWKKVEANE